MSSISRQVGVRAARRSILQADILAGRDPALLRFSSSAQLRHTIANPLALPVLQAGAASDLQTSGGENVFLDGYSDPDGPDV